ncbi:MAG: M18 family aminopeptidase [Lachnospiraceae bacterium]|nr:M18 family aminopeptidase [Lachnospiraceae bacterium]
MNAIEVSKEMLRFIDESPTAFHAVANAEAMLKEAGFELLVDQQIVHGGKYYEKRNNSSIIAFEIPEGEFEGFRVVSSHSDSPCFKIKENPEMKVNGQYVKLNTERYGGIVMFPWLDRPLSAAGRVIVKENGKLVEKLVNFKKDLLIIPNLPIHYSRDLNEGFKPNAQVDMLPLMAMDQDCTLKKLCAQQLGVAEEDILGSDLYVYNRDQGRIMGADDSLVGAPRLDDLQCAFATLKGFLCAKPGKYVSIYALFDNEESGSTTKQGANSPFITDIIDDVIESFGMTLRQKKHLLANSFMLSADNAHALHPNHPEKYDSVNHPYINGGVVLKFSGSQKYTTDGASAAVVRDICKEHNIKLQNQANRSDIAGGSTLGNILMAQAAFPAADIGFAQFAMHSAFETAGVEDTLSMVELVKYFMS